MTKKILAAIIAFFVCNAHAATYLDTENRLWFSADVVKNAIVDHVPDKKQQTVADLYQDLMEQETGKISIDSLFKVCRKAGFNTYKYDGFTQCRAFIEQMLTDAEIAQNVDLNGFCPGLDEKGNNPNKLRSITDKTRIGDFCSSTNIYMGEVIFKPGYNCSCMAAVCNPGFEFQRGACVTKVADGNGNCLREAHKKTSENNYLEKCKSFCEKRYAGKACKYTSVVMSHSTGQCICNPNSNEVDAAYESMHRAEERQINNLKYYAVCGNHKGKSGGTEVCVEGVFNWVNVGRVQAAGLAQEYARVHYKDTIHCDMVNTELRGNDDFVKCASKKSKRYYEFEFDDIKESIDADIQWGVVKGICKIYNAESIQNKCLKSCTSEMSNTARTFGLTAKTDNGYCVFSGVSMTAEEAKSKLAKIDGIDNYVFYHGIQIQGSPNVVTQLRQYIKSTGKTIRTFDCIKNVGEIKNSILVGDDDVMRCTLNGQPIDFVFDDFSEAWVYVQEDGESKIQCVVSGGKFSGQECYGLTQQQCIDTNAKFLKQNPGASGFKWDGKECVSIDANEAQFYDGVIQIGTGLVAVVDCVVGTKLGCVMVMVESAGLAIEMTTGAAIENRAGDFLAVSTRCYARNCAVNTIKNAGEVLSVMGALDATSLNSVDKEFARLVGYLEPEDLSGVSDGDWSEIVTQLGGDPNDSSGTALVTLNRIGLGLQFASIGISGLRLTAQAITKLAGKGSRIGHTSTAVARALDTSGDAGRAANNASDAGRAANNATDAGRAANNASDAGHTTNNATDVLHADIDTYRNATNKNRVRAKYHPDSVPSTIQDKAHEIFIQMDNIDNMSEDELRALSRLMNEFDAEVAAEEAAAKAAAYAVRTTNAATDGARTVNTTADAARTTSRATYSSLDELAETPLQSAKGKLYAYGQTFDKTIDDFLYRNGGYPASWRRADLTDAEFDALRTDLRSHDLLLDTDPEGFLRISRISDSATNAAKTTSRATNATADASRTTNTATDAVRAGNYTSDAGRATNATDAPKSASVSDEPYVSSLPQRTAFTSQLDKTDARVRLRKFKDSKDPFNDGGLDADLTELVNGELAAQFPDDIHYLDIYSSGLQKWNTDTSKGLWTSIIYPNNPAQQDHFIRIIETALKHEKASIPIGYTGNPGHVFVLVKKWDQWAIIDQFGKDSYVAEKNIIKEVLKGYGVKSQNIKETINTLTGDGANRMDCFAYSSQVSFDNIYKSNDPASHRLSNPFKRNETDDYIELMKMAAGNLMIRL
ncbi:MAG: hypothetical protein R8M37_02080 [Alphaproteobacteria bacterium]|nr:hypothetical protein [Alphaproteobacteria bacterium]